MALAVSGGVVDLVREYLVRTGKYDEFRSIVARETNYTFPQGLDGENVEFALPNERLFDNGSRFSICRSKL